MADFNVGDRVVVEGSFGGFPMDGKAGKVLVLNAGKAGQGIGVEFDESFNLGHDCGGIGRTGYCRYGNPKTLIAESIFATAAPVVGPAQILTPDILKANYLKDPMWDQIYKVIEDDCVDKGLLYGPPGTGKTTSAFRRFAAKYGDALAFMTTAHEESIVEELLGQYIPQGSAWTFNPGLAVSAYKGGGIIINEINRASGPYATLCHAVFDDREVARLLLPTGEAVRPHATFKAFATMNGSPDDLHEALRDRFEVKIFVSRPSPEAMATLDDDMIELVKSSYSNPDNITVSFRAAKAFMKMRKIMKEEQAGEFVFGPTYADIITSIKLNKKKGAPWLEGKK